MSRTLPKIRQIQKKIQRFVRLSGSAFEYRFPFEYRCRVMYLLQLNLCASQHRDWTPFLSMQAQYIGLSRHQKEKLIISQDFIFEGYRQGIQYKNISMYFICCIFDMSLLLKMFLKYFITVFINKKNIFFVANSVQF